MLQVTPDWRTRGTADEIKREMNLEVSGPGWYLTDTDTVLILRNEEDSDRRWHSKGIDYYEVYVWNTPRTIFNEIALAPVRFDNRETFAAEKSKE